MTNKDIKINGEFEENLNNDNEAVEVKETLKNNEEVEDLLEEISEEVNNEEVCNIELDNKDKENKKNTSFLKRLLAGVLDQIMCVGSSIIIVFIISKILPLFGYRLVEDLYMLIIVYLIFGTLYGPILESSKLKNTLGKVLLKL